MSLEDLYVYKGSNDGEGDGTTEGVNDDEDGKNDTNKTQSRIHQWVKIVGLFIVILVITLILEYKFNIKIGYYKIFDTANSNTKEGEDKDASTGTTDKDASTGTINNIQLVFKGLNGTEKLKILDNDKRQLVGETIITVKNSETNKPGININFSTNKRSFYIYFLNDASSPARDLYLKSIKLNEKELPLDKHIRGDLRYPTDINRASGVSKGNFLWGTKDILTTYQIDLDPRT
jgi:hypothetical protein